MNDANKKLSPAQRAASALTPEARRNLVEDGASAYGLLIHDMGESGFDHERYTAICAGIRARAERIEKGDTRDMLSDLVGQLAWLSELIAHCARRGAACSDRPAAADVWLRLALKATAQHSRTAGVLAAIAAGKPKAIND